MARALIVGCGCRGRALGRELRARGWEVRGTSRDPRTLELIEESDIEPALADPDRIGTVLDRIDGVSLIYWLLGSASGAPEKVVALHTSRLRRLLEEIVDTPVRGFVYELAAELQPSDAIEAFEILRHAGDTWRIPYEVVDAGPSDHDHWVEGMVGAAVELIG